jgi:hypothetical protein
MGIQRRFKSANRKGHRRKRERPNESYMFSNGVDVNVRNSLDRATSKVI